MGRSNAERLGALIPAALKRVEQQHHILRSVQREWKALVGKALAAHTSPVGLRRGRLVIHVDRPGENFTLSYERAGLLERLRKTTNGKIEELVIRPGELKRK